MTKTEAIHRFWRQFAPAYDESTVPDNATFPYITYSVATDSIGNVIYGSASIWDKSYSWRTVEDLALLISQTITNLYPPAIEIDGGRLYLSKGTPFMQRVKDDNDAIRHILLNVNYEFLTQD